MEQQPVAIVAVKHVEHKGQIVCIMTREDGVTAIRHSRSVRKH